MDFNAPELPPRGSHELVAFQHRKPISLLLKRFMEEYKTNGSDDRMSYERCSNIISVAANRTISKQFIKDLLAGKGADTGHVIAVRNFLLAMYPDTDPASLGAANTLQIAQSLQNLISRFRPADSRWMTLVSGQLRFFGVDVAVSLCLTIDWEKATLCQGNAHPVIPVTATFTALSCDQSNDDPHHWGLADYFFRGHVVARQGLLTGPLCDYQRKFSVLLTMPTHSQSETCVHLTVLVAAGNAPFHHLTFAQQGS